MGLLDELRNLGVNIDEGADRLMGNVSLYERMLVKFGEMMKKSPVSPDFDLNDYADVIEAAHAVKGAAGNLSITPVYEAYSEVVSLLRAGQPGKAKEILEKVQPAQKDILECIWRYS